jgi:quercetin dioxygenase-like cupin family protein
MADQGIEKAKKIDLASDVDYSNASIVSKVLLKNSAGNLTLFAFDKDQELSEHSAPFDACVQVVEGEGEIIINHVPHHLVKGEFIIMPANIPHAVKAVAKFKMLLTMIRPYVQV